MKKLTLEEAHGLLKELDPAMPAEFSVLCVAYSRDMDAYCVRWFDEKEKEIYDDGVAQAKADGAKAAYSFEPTCSFSAIWFNEGEDGSESPVASVLGPDDVRAMAGGGEKLVLLDRA